MSLEDDKSDPDMGPKCVIKELSSEMRLFLFLVLCYIGSSSCSIFACVVVPKPEFVWI